jgi:hypothetical protein
MTIRQIKFWRCALCEVHGIAEHRTEHTYEGEVPDQSSCDFSTYDDHIVVGGRLFADLPERPWRRVDKTDPSTDDPVGGICHSCLGRREIQELVPHIRLA